MISLLLMVCKQVSEFETGQIVACNDCGLLLHDIAKELNFNHSSIDVFPKNYKKIGNYHEQESCGHKRKTTASKDMKIVRAAIVLIKTFMSAVCCFICFFQFCTFLVFLSKVLLGNKDQLSMTWPQMDIKEFLPRWYQLKDVGLEIFLTNGKTCLLAFNSTEVNKDFFYPRNLFRIISSSLLFLL